MPKLLFELFIGAFLREIVSYLFIKPLARPVEKRLSFLKATNPLLWQPFHHVWHHKGNLADCEIGLCRPLH